MSTTTVTRSTDVPASTNLSIRRASERGLAEYGWLASRHTFSFGDYFDPKWQGFRNLRVINDDHVAAGQGFGTHAHRNMEIISYVLEGKLEHKDSMGTGSVLVPGDVQRMSAGTGVRHSELNGDKEAPVHFLQIWLQPAKAEIEPGYEEKRVTTAEKQGKLKVLASPTGREGGLTVHADATMLGGVFSRGEHAVHEVKPGRHAWIHVARGTIKVGGHRLSDGDAAFTSDAGSIVIEGEGDGEVLVFDLA